MVYQALWTTARILLRTSTKIRRVRFYTFAALCIFFCGGGGGVERGVRLGRRLNPLWVFVMLRYLKVVVYKMRYILWGVAPQVGACYVSKYGRHLGLHQNWEFDRGRRKLNLFYWTLKIWQLNILLLFVHICTFFFPQRETHASPPATYGVISHNHST